MLRIVHSKRRFCRFTAVGGVFAYVFNKVDALSIVGLNAQRLRSRFSQLLRPRRCAASIPSCFCHYRYPTPRHKKTCWHPRPFFAAPANLASFSSFSNSFAFFLRKVESSMNKLDKALRIFGRRNVYHAILSSLDFSDSATSYVSSAGSARTMRINELRCRITSVMCLAAIKP